MGLVCPYCDAEISERDIEAEDGCCPECGAAITALDDLGEEDEFDESDEENEFEDEEDDRDGFPRERGRDPFKDAFRDVDDDN